MKNKCFWGHDGDIVEYGTHDCMCKCKRCGAYYSLVGRSDGLERAFYGLMLLSIIAGVIGGIVQGIIN